MKSYTCKKVQKVIRDEKEVFMSTNEKKMVLTRYVWNNMRFSLVAFYLLLILKVVKKMNMLLLILSIIMKWLNL